MLSAQCCSYLLPEHSCLIRLSPGTEGLLLGWGQPARLDGGDSP